MQIGNLIRSLFSTEPVEEQVEETTAMQEITVSQSEDCFEAADVLPMRTAELILPETQKSLELLKKRAHATAQMVGGQVALAASLKVRGFQKRLELIQGQFESGNLPSRSELITLRRQMWECSLEIDTIQKSHIATNLQSCGRPILARLEVLALLQAIKDGDTAYVKQRLPRFKNLRYPEIQQSELLYKFDSHLLKLFAERGLVESMTYDEHDELEEALEELPDLEQKYAEATKKCEKLEAQILGSPDAVEKQDLQLLARVVSSAANQVGLQIDDLNLGSRKLKQQYYLRDHFYVARPNCLPLLERLVHVMREAHIAIASPERLNKQVIETLYRGHFEMFCALEVIERLSRKELDEAVAQGFCDRNEFVRMGNSYCRISNSGLLKLKEAIALTRPFVPKTPAFPKPAKIVEREQESKKDFEEEATEPTGTRFPRYAIIPLEEAIVFY